MQNYLRFVGYKDRSSEVKINDIKFTHTDNIKPHEQQTNNEITYNISDIDIERSKNYIAIGYILVGKRNGKLLLHFPGTDLIKAHTHEL